VKRFHSLRSPNGKTATSFMDYATNLRGSFWMSPRPLRLEFHLLLPLYTPRRSSPLPHKGIEIFIIFHILSLSKSKYVLRRCPAPPCPFRQQHSCVSDGRFRCAVGSGEEVVPTRSLASPWNELLPNKPNLIEQHKLFSLFLLSSDLSDCQE
jgi:hypothetical protein